MKYTLAICMLLATTSAIRLNGDDKKEGDSLPNMGISSRVALDAGRIESAGVVAAQESFMATHNANHATAMAAAAKGTVDQKTSVWVPRNAVMIQL